MKLLGILNLMLFATPVLAQTKTDLSLHWERIQSLPPDSGQASSLGVAGPVTGSCKDWFIVAGGANFPTGMPWEGGAKKYHDRIFIYRQERNKLKLYSASGKLPQSLAYAASCSTPEGLLVAGGENEQRYNDKTWLIGMDKKGQLSFTALPSLPVPVSNAAITLSGQMIFLAGGENNNQTFSQLLALDLQQMNAGWKKLSDIPQPVSHAVFTAGKSSNRPVLYLCGGRRKNSNGISTIYNTLWTYDVNDNKWEEKAALPYDLCAGTGIQTDDHSILLFGGDKGIVFNKVESLISAINNTSDPEKKKELTREKNKLQSTHPGFSREILKYSVDEDKWYSSGELPYETPVTTSAVNTRQGILIPSGEIKAGVRTPGILKLKIRHKHQ